MKNEKVISKRNGTTTCERKATTAAQTIGRMGNGVKQARGRKGNRPQQLQASAFGAFADGFLRERFLPMYSAYADTPQDKGIGEGVLNSLAILSENYNLKPFDATGLQYPYNILLAHHDTERQLRRKRLNLELLIMEQDNGQYSFGAKQTAGRSYDLYYIPVRPLFKLLRSGKSKLAENLLLAVFSYLYHIARVPGHRDEETFLHYHTEMISEWIDDDNGWEEDDNSQLKLDIKRAAYEGDYVQKRIWHRYHLENFAQTVSTAKPKSELEKRCLKVAADFLKLWQDHPDGNIFKNLLLSDGRTGEEDDDGYEYGNTIYAHEYIHFIHDIKDRLYDDMYSNIQTEFNEKIHTQEHSIINLYNENFNKKEDGLNYATRFFELADDLCDILMNIL